jgi:hypothetical protein
VCSLRSLHRSVQFRIFQSILHMPMPPHAHAIATPSVRACMAIMRQQPLVCGVSISTSIIARSITPLSAAAMSCALRRKTIVSHKLKETSSTTAQRRSSSSYTARKVTGGFLLRTFISSFISSLCCLPVAHSLIVESGCGRHIHSVELGGGSIGVSTTRGPR